MTTVSIEAAVLDEIFRLAKKEDNLEVMGLLASRRKSRPVSAACVLPTDERGPSHAVAAPLTIRRAIDELLRRGFIPRGIFHSHGHHPVFCSGTDVQTGVTFLPSMADHNFEPLPGAATKCVPVATGPATATCPRAEGGSLDFVLAGRPLGDGVRTIESWSTVRTAFIASAPPRVVVKSDRLTLEAAGVRLTLGIPDGASVSWSTRESELRIALLPSLVVNARGDVHVEAVVVRDLAGVESIDTIRECRLEIVDPRHGDETPIEVFDGRCRACIG